MDMKKLCIARISWNTLPSTTMFMLAHAACNEWYSRTTSLCVYLFVYVCAATAFKNEFMPRCLSQLLIVYYNHIRITSHHITAFECGKEKKIRKHLAFTKFLAHIFRFQICLFFFAQTKKRCHSLKMLM